ncbi:MAG TPA: hypothetical protein VL981_06210 [Candidatus Methylacidiphilales bacterium]|nr:hypothetical protein [Candidatus Methylacidiphilales bacterium]
MINTIEEIQISFNEQVAAKVKAGLSKQQAENVAAGQIIRDAQGGAIKEKAAKEFIILCEIAKGSTRAAGEEVVKSLLSGQAPRFAPCNSRKITQASEVPEA